MAFRNESDIDLEAKALAEKIPGGGGQWKNQIRKTAPISLPIL